MGIESAASSVNAQPAQHHAGAQALSKGFEFY
jgi:hypothetical protein